MTVTLHKGKRKTGKASSATAGFAIFIFTLILSMKYGDVLKAGILQGIKLSVTTIVPAVFPFLIITDILLATGAGNISLFAKAFSKILRISPKAAFPFLCGNLCGFPLGAKLLGDEYSRGNISKEDLECAVGISNNPSIAFTVSAVGMGMRGNLIEGLLLFASVLLATVSIGVVFRPRRMKNQIFEHNTEQKINISASIKNAGFTALGISSYIIFFSFCISAISIFLESEILIAIVASVLEVGSAASLLTKAPFDPAISFALTAFALGFSGISVHLQAFSFLPDEVSRKKYVLLKLCEGLGAAVLAFLFYKLI